MAERIQSIPEARLLLASLRSVGYNEETAIADIQLFGTKRQIELAQQFAEEIARNKESSTLELLILLREDLRKELRLEKVPRKFKFLRFSK